MLRLNAAAFTELPDQGGWTEQDLRARMAEDWFDPAGLLLAHDAGGGLVGFHWTKSAIRDRTVDRQHLEPLGEVYVLGVHPHRARPGPGPCAHARRACTTCATWACPRPLLFVDATTPLPSRCTRSLGFAAWDSDMLFRR